MSSHKIAPVKWYMGQTLLPDHFTAHENALQSEMRLRTQIQGLPAYGFAQLSWNEPLLIDGSLGIHAMTAVLPGGGIIDVPANCSVPELSLAATGASRCAVFLHLLSEPAKIDRTPLYEDDPKHVQRIYFRAVLSTQETVENTIGTLKVGEFEKAADSTWSASAKYIPPILQVGTTPFLRMFTMNLSRMLRSFRVQLESQLKDTFFGLAKLVSIRRCLTEVYCLQSVLEDLEHQVYRHPFHLFESVRRFYLELCAFQETLPEGDPFPYIHNDLGSCFGRLYQYIEDKIRPLRSQSTHIRFLLQDNVYKVAPLPAEASSASEVYVLVQRQSLHDKVSLEGVKLAAPSRLVHIHRLALKGVPIKHLSQPHFPHSFGPDIDFYQLTTGEEWETAQREGSLAFYNQPTLEKASGIFLFWRRY